MAATTLTAGSIRDLPIRSSGRLTLTPGSGGTITILSRDSSDDTAVPRSISSAETLSLVADSTLSFQAVTADASYEFFPFDSAANMAWLQSSVSGGGASGLSTWAQASVTVIGDSIGAYGDGVGAGGALAGPTSQSIPQWTFSQLNRVPLHILANRAVGGVTIDTVMSSQLATAMADASDILWIHAGVNNLNPSIDATTPTVATITERMRRLLDVARTKPLVILDALTPLASDSISGAAPRRADIPLVNAAFEALAADYDNVIFNDIYTPLAIDATSGTATAGMTVAADGTHLTTRGAYTAGVATAATLEAAALALRPRHRPTVVNLLPAMTGTGGTKTASTGTINGDVADSCNIQIASNATSVVVTASVGTARTNSQRLRIVNGNAAATVVRFQLAVFTNYLTGLASGDLVRASGYVGVVSQSGLYRHDFSIQQDPSGAVVNFPGMQKSPQEDGTGDSFPTYPVAPYQARITAIGTLTATPGSLNVTYSFEVAPGGDVTLDVWGWTLEEVLGY